MVAFSGCHLRATHIVGIVFEPLQRSIFVITHDLSHQIHAWVVIEVTSGGNTIYDYSITRDDMNHVTGIDACGYAMTIYIEQSATVLLIKHILLFVEFDAQRAGIHCEEQVGSPAGDTVARQQR